MCSVLRCGTFDGDAVRFSAILGIKWVGVQLLIEGRRTMSADSENGGFSMAEYEKELDAVVAEVAPDDWVPLHARGDDS